MPLLFEDTHRTLGDAAFLLSLLIACVHLGKTLQLPVSIFFMYKTEETAEAILGIHGVGIIHINSLPGTMGL